MLSTVAMLEWVLAAARASLVPARDGAKWVLERITFDQWPTLAPDHGTMVTQTVVEALAGHLHERSTP